MRSFSSFKNEKETLTSVSSATVVVIRMYVRKSIIVFYEAAISARDQKKKMDRKNRTQLANK